MDYKKHEVEFRALLTPEIFETLLTKGRKQFAQTFNGPLTIEDAYFCPKSVRKFSEVEMDDVGSYSLRLRRETETDKTRITLNTKVIQKIGDHNSWLEHEVGLTSYEEAQDILRAIGFKLFFELEKKRYSFREGEVYVCLEDIAEFQPAVELEILTSEDRTEEAKLKLLDYLTQNNVDRDVIVKKSITNMLMREKSFF